MSKANRRRAAGGAAQAGCPCGSGTPYPDCCRPLHRRQAAPQTAAALMRSRFAAYALGDADYLLYSWHPSTRPHRLLLEADQRWIRLDILRTGRGGLFDTTGTVEFRAHYRHRGRPATVHEHSRFVRQDGRWLYLDAVAPVG